MQIFGELVKRYWHGTLKSSDDLNHLAQDNQRKYHLTDQDLPFIKDHIRIAMGQNPKGNADFDDELSIIKNSKEIRQPIIEKIEGPCEACEGVIE